MTEWHARIDALQADASARSLPISDDVTNGFVAWGGTYTRLDDLGIRSDREFPDDPSVDLSGVFVRVGLAFHWLRD